MPATTRWKEGEAVGVPGRPAACIGRCSTGERQVSKVRPTVSFLTLYGEKIVQNRGKDPKDS